MRDDLREEIRSAFAKEQAAHPPSAGMRRSIVNATVARPQNQPRLEWIAVTAALVITALVIVSLLSGRASTRSQAPAHASPRPLATPTAYSGDFGTPPPGVPLVYVADSQHPGWYIGFDWSGKPRGTIKVDQPMHDTQRLIQAPDGSAFAYSALGKGGADTFLDRLGRPIASPQENRHQDSMWTDDGKQLCTLDYASGSWQIGLRVPGAPPTAHAIHIGDGGVVSGLIAIGLRACSPTHDRAVVVYAYSGRPVEVWVVRISDGSVVLHSAYAADTVADIVSSADGSLIAVNSNKSTGYIGGPSADTTVVQRVADGAHLMKLDPSLAVVAFSADGKQVLMTTSPWVEGAATHLAIFDVQSGVAIWHYDGQEELVTFISNPSGEGFALMLKSVYDSGLQAPVDVVLVSGGGIETRLPGRYERP